MNIEKLWQEYQTALKKFLHSKINNPSDIDDLMQEIFIKTYQNIHTVKDISKVKSWLFQLANNTIIDFYRTKGKTVSNDEFQFELNEDETVKQDLMRCLSPFIQALPQDKSELITAVDLNNEEQKQLAEKMNISYSTLKSRVQASRKELRSLFDDCCHFEFDCNGRAIDYQTKTAKTRC